MATVFIVTVTPWPSSGVRIVQWKRRADTQEQAQVEPAAQLLLLSLAVLLAAAQLELLWLSLAAVQLLLLLSQPELLQDADAPLADLLLYPSAYQPPPLSVKDVAEMTFLRDPEQSGQVVSGSSFMLCQLSTTFWQDWHSYS
jgi:hypothetical protein